MAAAEQLAHSSSSSRAGSTIRNFCNFWVDGLLNVLCLLLLPLLPLLLKPLLPLRLFLLLLLLYCCRSVQLQPLPGWHISRDVSRWLQAWVYPGQLLADESPLPCCGTQHQHHSCMSKTDTRCRTVGFAYCFASVKPCQWV